MAPCFQKAIVYMYLYFFFSFFHYCSGTIVSIFPHHWLPPHPFPPPTLNSTPLWLCPCVLHTCSLMTLPPFPPIIPSPLPSGYCQFVLYFNVSGYFLFAFMPYDLTYKIIKFSFSVRENIFLNIYLKSPTSPTNPTSIVNLHTIVHVHGSIIYVL